MRSTQTGERVPPSPQAWHMVLVVASLATLFPPPPQPRGNRADPANGTLLQARRGSQALAGQGGSCWQALSCATYAVPGAGPRSYAPWCSQPSVLISLATSFQPPSLPGALVCHTERLRAGRWWICWSPPLGLQGACAFPARQGRLKDPSGECGKTWKSRIPSEHAVWDCTC